MPRHQQLLETPGSLAPLPLCPFPSLRCCLATNRIMAALRESNGRPGREQWRHWARGAH